MTQSTCRSCPHLFLIGQLQQLDWSCCSKSSAHWKTDDTINRWQLSIAWFEWTSQTPQLVYCSGVGWSWLSKLFRYQAFISFAISIVPMSDCNLLQTGGQTLDAKTNDHNKQYQQNLHAAELINISISWGRCLFFLCRELFLAPTARDLSALIKMTRSAMVASPGPHIHSSQAKATGLVLPSSALLHVGYLAALEHAEVSVSAPMLMLMLATLGLLQRFHMGRLELSKCSLLSSSLRLAWPPSLHHPPQKRHRAAWEMLACLTACLP